MRATWHCRSFAWWQFLTGNEGVTSCSVTVCDRESTCDRMWQFFVTVSDGKWVILAPKWSSFRRKILPFAVMRRFRRDLQNEISTSISCGCDEHYKRSGGALKKNFYWCKDAILEKASNIKLFQSIVEPCIALSRRFHPSADATPTLLRKSR